MNCYRCGSNNVSVQIISENKKTGIFTVLLYVLLLCLPPIGWIILFILLVTRRPINRTVTICQNCGNKIIY
jgi:DNA-directed RNA polymerase subunit RPC12/RpoP